MTQQNTPSSLPESLRRLSTVQTIAAIFDVHPETVYRWTRAGVIPCIHVGKRTVRFDLQAVRAAVMATRGEA